MTFFMFDLLEVVETTIQELDKVLYCVEVTERVANEEFSAQLEEFVQKATELRQTYCKIKNTIDKMNSEGSKLGYNVGFKEMFNNN